MLASSGCTALGEQPDCAAEQTLSYQRGEERCARAAQAPDGSDLRTRRSARPAWPPPASAASPTLIGSPSSALSRVISIVALSRRIPGVLVRMLLSPRDPLHDEFGSVGGPHHGTWSGHIPKAVERKHNLRVAKPWKCRLGFHDWEAQENPETHAHYEVCRRCDAERDTRRPSSRPRLPRHRIWGTRRAHLLAAIGGSTSTTS